MPHAMVEGQADSPATQQSLCSAQLQTSGGRQQPPLAARSIHKAPRAALRARDRPPSAPSPPELIYKKRHQKAMRPSWGELVGHRLSDQGPWRAARLWQWLACKMT
jgi:hypothetical protein